MRSLWAGAISLGLVNIPVRLYPATQSREVAFRQVAESGNEPLPVPVM